VRASSPAFFLSRALTLAALAAGHLLLLGAPGASALEPEAATGRAEKQPVYASRQMVAAAHPLAADAGLEILRAGGAAIDAAIAVQLVLGLVEPQSSGIGGGAFLLHWSEKERRIRSYDGREAAPARARADRFLESDGTPRDFYDAVVSGLAVGVPGVLRMLELAHRRHGRLEWRELFAPAIRLAEEGFAMSPRLHALLARDRFLRASPGARDLYYGADGRPRPVDARVVNRAYAQTLRQIAARGADAFYAGPIAREIVRAVRSHPKPGDLAESDLAGYRALEREPVCSAYREHRICGMGPPSAGAITVLQILGILERLAFDRAPPASAEAVHLFAEAARLAYADRARYVADPAFAAVPVQGLLDSRYLRARAETVGARSIGSAQPGRPEGARDVAPAAANASSGTSHISVVDSRGDAVAMTSSIENAFGSRIFVRGFLLNNQLTDFAFVPRREGLPVANGVAGGKRPGSGMAPTFVFSRDGALQMVLGSPGGLPIADYVAKTLVASIDWKLDIQEAIALPNFGSTNGPTFLERGSALEDLAEALAERGHVLSFAPLTSGLHGIERVRAGDPGNPLPGAGWRGGADPRREGVARGD
jgi:gamma-glutamyltranspeptidase/glutathione hydrolase